jgi:hypothetical protein
MKPPKDYAEELVLKFEEYSDSADERGFAIKSALVAVNEMIESYEFDVASDVVNQRYIDKLNYFDEVKKELEGL